MPGAKEEKTVAEPLAAGFGHFLHHIGAVGFLANVLLHFVQDENGVGNALAVFRQGILQRVRELLGGDVPRARELLAQQGFRAAFGRGEARVRREQRLGDHRAHVEIVEFASEVSPGRLDGGANRLVDVVLLQPQAKARLRVTLRQAAGLEHDAKQRQPHAVSRAGAQRAGGGM